jgi:hypothetical protein
MSRRILALLTLDADGTLTISAGPEIGSRLAPSWADKPSREITIEGTTIGDAATVHEREAGTMPRSYHAAGARLLARVRWLVDPPHES